MPMMPDRARQLRDRRDEIKKKIVQVEDLRPGSLVERYRRCGKPTCHCAHDGGPGHGRTRADDGDNEMTRRRPPQPAQGLMRPRMRVNLSSSAHS